MQKEGLTEGINEQTQPIGLKKRVKQWLWENQFYRKLYVEKAKWDAGRKINRETAPARQEFSKRIAAAQTRDQRLAIEKEIGEYFIKRTVESVLTLPRTDQEWMLDLFNISAEAYQEQFMISGDETDRDRAIYNRRTALALEKILFPEGRSPQTN